MIDAAQISPLLPAYLARQRWFSGSGLDPDVSPPEVPAVEVRALEIWGEGPPGLVWLVVDTHLGTRAGSYQVLLGVRDQADRPNFLAGKEDSLLGFVTGPDGDRLVYDALIDPELAMAVVDRVAPELGGVGGVRPLTVEQSNTSVVADERWICKIFRRLQEGANPDVDVPVKLWAHGFTDTPETIAVLRRDDVDLAIVRAFEAGGADGFGLAETSLRDLFDSRLDPAQSGGDFAPEAFRLGETIARMHRSLAEAYGTSEVPTVDIVDQVVAELSEVEVPGITSLDVAAYAGRVLRSLPDVLTTTRIHGDLHLGQLLRCDSGWLVLDFEGEPLRSLAERTMLRSPWQDVGALLRSFDYAAKVTPGRHDADMDEDPEWADARALGEAWRLRNCAAFRNGYLAEPAGPAAVAEGSVDPLVRFFELAKAVYEVGYELAHRPELADIPQAAIRTLLTDP